MPDECKYTVHVVPDADERMYAHVCFLAQASATAAKRLHKKLHEEINSLGYDPARFPVYFSHKPAVAGAILRYNFCAKRYRIVFEVIDDAVYVYDVQDCRQDTDKRLV